MIASTDSSQAKFSIGRGFLAVAIAVLAFVLVCAGLNALLPFPEVEIVSAEVRFFKQHQDEFDTIFLGSSRVHHGISPAMFDRTMREAGHPTRTFNFGISGMFPPESGYVLERLLSAKPRCLKWVFIELDELDTNISREEPSRRSLYWRDWKRTSLVLRKVIDGDDHGDARHLFYFHSALFAKNFTNIGRKVDLTWWMSHLGKKSAPPKGLGRDGDGYVPQVKTLSAAEVAAYKALLERAAAEAEFGFVSASTEHAYRQWADEVRKAGATPIFLVPPRITQIKFGFRPESGLAGAVMLFNDAKAYPQLYLSEVRFDADHVNGTGAEEFTRIVARRFSQLLQEKQIQ